MYLSNREPCPGVVMYLSNREPCPGVVMYLGNREPCPGVVMNDFIFPSPISLLSFLTNLFPTKKNYLFINSAYSNKLCSTHCRDFP